MNWTRGESSLCVFDLLLQKSLREETQLATPNLLLAKDQPVWIVAASSHVEKVDRCH